MRGLADLGEIGVLGEEAVAGMDRVDIGDFRGADDLRNVQIAFAAARRPDADGFIGKANVERVAIGLRINGDGANAQFLAGSSECAARFRRDWQSEFFETF